MVRLAQAVLCLVIGLSIQQASEEKTARDVEDRIEKNPTAAQTEQIYKKMRANLQYALCFELFLRIPGEKLQADHDSLVDFLPDETDHQLVKLKYFLNALQACIEKVGATSQDKIRQEIEQFKSGQKDLKDFEKYYLFDSKVYHRGITELDEKEKETATMFIVVQKQVQEIARKERSPEESKISQLDHEINSLAEMLGKVKNKIYVDVGIYIFVGCLLGGFISATHAFFLNRKDKAARRAAKRGPQQSDASREEQLDQRWLKLKELRKEVAELEKAAASG